MTVADLIHHFQLQDPRTIVVLPAPPFLDSIAKLGVGKCNQCGCALSKTLSWFGCKSQKTARCQFYFLVTIDTNKLLEATVSRKPTSSVHR